MREIKFRAWSKVAQSMIYWEDISKKENLGRLINNPNYILMQYTGIDDKYGKEIYEGDILTTDRYICIDEGKQNYVLIVEYDECSYYVVAHCVNKNKAGISNGMSDILDSDENYTVLGNIYENPELLNYRY